MTNELEFRLVATGIVLLFIVLLRLVFLVAGKKSTRKAASKVVDHAKSVASSFWRVERISVEEGVFVVILSHLWWEDKRFPLVAGPEHPDIKKISVFNVGDEVAFEFDETCGEFYYLRIKSVTTT